MHLYTTVEVKVKVDRSCMIEIIIISRNLIQWRLRSYRMLWEGKKTNKLTDLLQLVKLRLANTMGEKKLLATAIMYS